MKTTEIREMSASELDSKLAGLKEEQASAALCLHW